MGWFRRSPIRRKLELVVLASCGLALVLASLFLIQFQRGESRRALLRDTTILANILAENSRAAIAFEDPADASAKLQTLQSEAHVMAACLYGRSGELVAEFLRSESPGRCPKTSGDSAYHFAADSLSVTRPVVLNGKQIGAIYVESDLEGIRERLSVFGGTALLVLLGALAVAMALASRLQRGISGPILALADTARVIADKEDFSVRAVRQAEDEVGLLTDAFNAMLAGIEERESALQGAIAALQAENAERKAAEDRVQAQLARLELLNRITRAIGERQDLQSIFQVVIRSLEDHLPVDLCCVCLYDEVEKVLTVTSIGLRSEAFARELMLADDARLPIDESLAPSLLGSLLYQPDTNAVSPAFSQRLARAGLRSLVVAPLLVESRIFGLLLAARRSPDAFTSGECQFLRQLSEHSGLASHQAQLHGALQQAYDDLRQTQQAVMQQERLRALGQMASGIAHDINNSISPVALYAELLLERETHLSAEGRENLETIQRAIDDVAETVARMREFYRDNEPQVLLTPVQLNRLVPQVLDLTRVRWSDMAQKTGVAIDARAELAPDAPPVLGSESELREALTNLVFNAVDAMPEGGKLVLRTRTTGQAPSRDGDAARLVHLEVSDSGVGMSEETRRRCLEPFFTTKGERGTGLGLAMVYGSAKRHGAEVEIDSALGEGTTVRLTFAASEGADAARPQAASAFSGIPRLKVLAVDDDPLVLRALKECLEVDGHGVVTANDGREGIELFQAALEGSEPFAVVITDLGMPYVDGRRVAELVKSVSPATPVLMLTGWGQRLRADGEIPPHVDQLLSKPPKLREIRDVLTRYFVRPRS